MKFSVVTILQGIELSIFLLIFEWALQQCSGTAQPVMAYRCSQPVTHFVVAQSVCRTVSDNAIWQRRFTHCLMVADMYGC